MLTPWQARCPRKYGSRGGGVQNQILSTRQAPTSKYLAIECSTCNKFNLETTALAQDERVIDVMIGVGWSARRCLPTESCLLTCKNWRTEGWTPHFIAIDCGVLLVEFQNRVALVGVNGCLYHQYVRELHQCQKKKKKLKKIGNHN